MPLTRKIISLVLRLCEFKKRGGKNMSQKNITLAKKLLPTQQG